MKLRSIIEAPKSVTDYGSWQSGHIPKADFPLRKAKLKQPLDWRWRRIAFEALGEDFLVLIRLNEGKQEYYAYLGHLREDGMAVVCSHDLHTSHKNWHCHFVKGNVLKTNAGYLRDRDNVVYFPSGGSEVECTTPFSVNQSNALRFAAERFRFDMPEQSEMVL